MIDWLICCWYWDNNKLEVDCPRFPFKKKKKKKKRLFLAIKLRNPKVKWKKRRQSTDSIPAIPFENTTLVMLHSLNMASDHMPLPGPNFAIETSLNWSTRLLRWPKTQCEQSINRPVWGQSQGKVLVYEYASGSRIELLSQIGLKEKPQKE